MPAQLRALLVGHAPYGRSWSPCRILDRKVTSMPTPQREPLRRFTDHERAALERIASCGSERSDHVRRAIALLAVEQSRVYAHALHASGLRSVTTVADLV